MIFPLKGTKEISPDTRIAIDQVDEDIVLSCRAAQKSDQGKYSVTLKNKLGQDTATVNVIVLGTHLGCLHFRHKFRV